MSSRRTMTRSFSGNGRSSIDNGNEVPPPSSRGDSRSYLHSVRPENSYSSHRYSHYKPTRSTLCSVMAQLTEETQPSFETTLKSKSVSEACNVKFSCVVTGNPAPELTWYKDDMEMDRYCGLPKYEICHNGKTHSLQIYNCTIEDAAIYQASARNSKGIVSCSGVLEVGTMNEFKIHQRFFDKLKQKANKKRRELEGSRQRGTDNSQDRQEQRVSIARSQVDGRFPGEDKRKTQALGPGTEIRLRDGDEKGIDRPEASTDIPNGFSADTPGVNSEAEAVQENSNQALTYIYETVEIVTTRPPTKEFLSKRKIKISNGGENGKVCNSKQGSGKEKEDADGGVSLAQYLAESLQAQASEDRQNSAEEAIEAESVYTPVTEEGKAKHTEESQQALQNSTVSEVDSQTSQADMQPGPSNTQSPLASMFFSLRDIFFGSKNKNGYEAMECITNDHTAREGEKNSPAGPSQVHLRESHDECSVKAVQIEEDEKSPSKNIAAVSTFPQKIKTQKQQEDPVIQGSLNSDARIRGVTVVQVVESPAQKADKPCGTQLALSEHPHEHDRVQVSAEEESNCPEDVHVSQLPPPCEAERNEIPVKDISAYPPDLDIQVFTASGEQATTGGSKAQGQLKLDENICLSEHNVSPNVDLCPVEVNNDKKVKDEQANVNVPESKEILKTQEKKVEVKVDKSAVSIVNQNDTDRILETQGVKVIDTMSERSKVALELVLPDVPQTELGKDLPVVSELVLPDVPQTELRKDLPVVSELVLPDVPQTELGKDLLVVSELVRPDVPQTELGKDLPVVSELVRPDVPQSELGKDLPVVPELVLPHVPQTELGKDLSVVSELVLPDVPKPELGKDLPVAPELVLPDVPQLELEKYLPVAPELVLPDVPQPELGKDLPVAPELVLPDVPQIELGKDLPMVSDLVLPDAPQLELEKYLPGVMVLDSGNTDSPKAPKPNLNLCKSGYIIPEVEQLKENISRTEILESQVKGTLTTSLTNVHSSLLKDVVAGSKTVIKKSNPAAFSIAPNPILPNVKNDVILSTPEEMQEVPHKDQETNAEDKTNSEYSSTEKKTVSCAVNTMEDKDQQQKIEERCRENIIIQSTPEALPKVFVVPPISITYVDNTPAKPPKSEVSEMGSLVSMLRKAKSDFDMENRCASLSLEGDNKISSRAQNTEQIPDSPKSGVIDSSSAVSIGKLLTKQTDISNLALSIPDPSLKKTLVSVSERKENKRSQGSGSNPDTVFDQPKKDKPDADIISLTSLLGPSRSPTTTRRSTVKGNSVPESPGLMAIPVIQVDGGTSDIKREDEQSEKGTPPAGPSCESSPKLRRADSLTLIPSATPEELASGARRKIFMLKPKGEETEVTAPDSQARKDENPKRNRASPEQDTSYMSPGQSRRSFLQTPTSQQTPPTERRSPLVSRKKTTLDVPKRHEETVEETKNIKTDSQSAEGKLNPLKAPQVIRKIRSEPYSDSMGHLKLWCQFFNVLSESTIRWCRDEVEIAEVKRRAGDESQVALAIVQASSRDCGVYCCSIKNEYGTDSTDFLLSADILSEFVLREDLEVGEEIEVTPMLLTKGLADPGGWGDKFFGRIMIEEAHIGEGCTHKACRVKVIYGLDPIFESGSTCVIKVRNPILYETQENNLIERNLEITKEECKTQNTAREYCKIFGAEARVIENFGPALEIIPLYLIYRPANTIPYATVEADLKGVFLRYCLTDGMGRLIMRNVSEVEQKCCAFQHWIHQWTNGNLLFTQLGGVGMKITNVGIATKSRGYQGLSDNVKPQIFQQFLAQHQCNYYCGLLSLRSLKTMDSLQQPGKPKASRSPLLGRKMGSGSSSPQLQKKGTHSPLAPRRGTASPKVAKKSESGDSQSIAKHKAVEIPKFVRMR